MNDENNTILLKNLLMISNKKKTPKKVIESKEKKENNINIKFFTSEEEELLKVKPPELKKPKKKQIPIKQMIDQKDVEKTITIITTYEFDQIPIREIPTYNTAIELIQLEKQEPNKKDYPMVKDLVLIDDDVKKDIILKKPKKELPLQYNVKILEENKPKTDIVIINKNSEGVTQKKDLFNVKILEENKPKTDIVIINKNSEGVTQKKDLPLQYNIKILEENKPKTDIVIINKNSEVITQKKDSYKQYEIKINSNLLNNFKDIVYKNIYHDDTSKIPYVTMASIKLLPSLKLHNSSSNNNNSIKIITKNQILGNTNNSKPKHYIRKLTYDISALSFKRKNYEENKKRNKNIILVFNNFIFENKIILEWVIEYINISKYNKIYIIANENLENKINKFIKHPNVYYIRDDSTLYITNNYKYLNEIIVFDINFLKKNLSSINWIKKCVFISNEDIYKDIKLNKNIDHSQNQKINILYYANDNSEEILKLFVMFSNLLNIRKDIFITIISKEKFTDDKILHFLELLSNNISLKICFSSNELVTEINNCDYIMCFDNKYINNKNFSIFKKPLITNLKFEYRFTKYYIKSFDYLFNLLCHIDKISTFDYYKTKYSVAYLSNSGIPHNISGYTIRTQSILENFLHHKNIICFVRPDKHKLQNNGIEIYYYDKNIIYIYLNTMFYEEQLYDFLNNSNIKFLWSASDYHNGILSAKLGKTLNIKSIYEIRGLWFLSLKAQDYVNHEQKFFDKYFEMEKNACIMNDSVICENKILKKYCIENFEINPDKISVLNNGVNIPDMHEFKIDIFKNKKITFGYIGSVVSYEGLHNLISAVNLIENFDTTVYIIGGGKTMDSINTQKSIKKLIADYNLEEKIKLVGQVSHDEIKKYYDMIDIFCLPRIDIEVCNIVAPLKPYEAMMYGKIVLASSVEALADIVTDGYNGILFQKNNINDLCDKMKKIMNFEYDLENIQKNSYEYIKNKSWKHNIDSVIDIFY
jgi:glycosyltransferase involved in cell wall biosynthesis